MRKHLWVVLMVLLPVISAADQTDTNKAVAKRVFDEMFTQGKFDLVAELYAADFVNHGRTRDIGLAEDQAAARGWKAAFPDLVMTADLMVAEKDLVAVLWRAKGTNTGEGNGLPATGRRGQGRGITVWRIVDGKVREEWSEFSTHFMLQQLGLLPGSTPPKEDQAWWPVPDVEFNRTAPDILEQNRKIARSVFEVILGQGKYELFDSLYAPGFVNHGINKEFKVQDEIEGTRGFRQLAPDLKVNVMMTIAQGDCVAVVYTAGGTNTGAAMGYPATGKTFELRGISILRILDGRITDEWSELDRYEALQQLGLAPAD